MAVGENGMVFFSTDGGETWQPKTSGTTGELRSVAFANAERARCGRRERHSAPLDRRGRELATEDEWHHGKAFVGRLRDARAGAWR